MSLLDSIQSLLKDPPPEFAFEISADGIAMSRTRSPAAVQHASLEEGVVEPSPVKENITDMGAFSAAVKKLVPPAGGRRTAALILPDNAMRLAVLEFDSFPEKEEERAALVRFRLKKTVPFDVETSSVAWHVQADNKVVVALTPAMIVAQYEAPFRAAGLQPGVVTPAALAMLELLPATGSYLVAHRHSGFLSVLVVGGGVLTLTRSLELSDHSETGGDWLDEVVSDLYATRIYVEDHAGARPERLYLAGFDSDTSRVASRLATELDMQTEVVREQNPGLAGYLKSLSPASALPVRKAAA